MDRKKKVALEILSGDKSPNQYRKKWGKQFDKVIFVKPEDLPRTLEGEKKLKKKLWKKIQKEL